MPVLKSQDLIKLSKSLNNRSNNQQQRFADHVLVDAKVHLTRRSVVEYSTLPLGKRNIIYPEKTDGEFRLNENNMPSNTFRMKRSNDSRINNLNNTFSLVLRTLPFKRRTPLLNGYVRRRDLEAMQHIRRRRQKFVIFNPNVIVFDHNRKEKRRHRRDFNDYQRQEFKSLNQKPTTNMIAPFPKSNLFGKIQFNQYKTLPNSELNDNLNLVNKLSENHSQHSTNDIQSRQKRTDTSTYSAMNYVQTSISDSRISIINEKEGDHMRSHLVVEALGREDLDRLFTCKVSNTNLLKPFQETARLDMIRECSMIDIREQCI